MITATRIELAKAATEINYPSFTPFEIAKFFGEFERDIENYKRVITKLKRKKIDFDEQIFEHSIQYLRNKEQNYFQMMADMFAAEDEEIKDELIAELSWLIYNRRGVQQQLFNYEMERTYSE